MEKVYNCFNCDFLYDYDHKHIYCDIKLYNQDKLIKVDRLKGQQMKDCPSHSDKDVIDTRYGMANNSIKEAPDACCMCGRRLDLKREDTYVCIEGEENNRKRCIKCDKTK